MEIKILARSTILLAGPKVLKFILGIFRAKLIAIFLGVTGAGIISQLQGTINQISTFTLSSLPEGMVKLIAEENSLKIDIEKISRIIKTYLIIVIPLTILVTLLGFIFSDNITIFVFGDAKYRTYMEIGFVALPISILSASSVSLLQAFKEIKSIALAGMLIILINFVLFIPLIYFYKIPGGVVYVTLSFIVTFLVHYFLMKKNVFRKYGLSFNDILKSVYSRKYFKELIAFMSFGLVAGTYYIFTEITTRAIVVKGLGIDKLGIYSPITAWASLFVGFVLPSLSTYLFPRISEAKDNADITGVVNDVIRLTTFITLPFIIIGISLRDWIVPLFYSIDFIEATIYLPYHFAALLFTIWSFAFTYVFAPTGRLKPFLIFAIVLHTLSLALVYFLVPEFGLFGYLAKFVITPMISTIGYFFYWKYQIQFKLKKDNIKIIIYSLSSITVLLLLQNELYYLQFISIMLLGMQLFLLNDREKSYLLKQVKNIFKNFGR